VTAGWKHAPPAAPGQAPAATEALYFGFALRRRPGVPRADGQLAERACRHGQRCELSAGLYPAEAALVAVHVSGHPGALPPVAGWVPPRRVRRGAWCSSASCSVQLRTRCHPPGSSSDYARADLRMLPRGSGGREHGPQVVLNCLALLAVGLLPVSWHDGSVYFLGALLLGPPCSRAVSASPRRVRSQRAPLGLRNDCLSSRLLS